MSSLADQSLGRDSSLHFRRRPKNHAIFIHRGLSFRKLASIGSFHRPLGPVLVSPHALTRRPRARNMAALHARTSVASSTVPRRHCPRAGLGRPRHVCRRDARRAAVEHGDEGGQSASYEHDGDVWGRVPPAACV